MGMGTELLKGLGSVVGIAGKLIVKGTIIGLKSGGKGLKKTIKGGGKRYWSCN